MFVRKNIKAVDHHPQGYLALQTKFPVQGCMFYRSSVSLWTLMALGRLPVYVEMEKLYCSCIWDKFSVNSKWEII